MPTPRSNLKINKVFEKNLKIWEQWNLNQDLLCMCINLYIYIHLHMFVCVFINHIIKPTNSLEACWNPTQFDVYVGRRLQSEQDHKWAPKQSQQDFPEGTLPPLAIHTMDWSSIKSHIWGKKSLHEACCVPSIPMIWVLVTLLNTLFCSLDRLKVVHLSHPSNPHFWVEWVLRPQVCLTPSHGTWQQVPEFQVKVAWITVLEDLLTSNPTKDPVTSRPSSVVRWAAVSRPGPHCRHWCSICGGKMANGNGWSKTWLSKKRTCPPKIVICRPYVSWGKLSWRFKAKPNWRRTAIK